MSHPEKIDPWKIVEAIEGPRLSIPVALVLRLGDLRAAAFIQQCAFLSSVCCDADGWFFLQQAGEPDLRPDATLFEKLGSWRAALALSPENQLSIRRKLVGMGLLEEDLRGIPARLHYRVRPQKYLAFLAGGPPPNQFPGNPETRFGENRNQGSEKAGTYIEEERKEERELRIKQREHAQPQAAVHRPAARDAQPLSGSFLGIAFDPRNRRDVDNLAKIKGFGTDEIARAAARARDLDPMGRALPTATLKILLAKKGLGAMAKPSRLGVRDGSRVADLAAHKEPHERDLRGIKFPGGLYLFENDVVLTDAVLEKTEGLRSDLKIYIDADQIALVSDPGDLPERVRLKYQGIVTRKMVPVDLAIRPEELPDFAAGARWKGENIGAAQASNPSPRASGER